MNIAKNIVKKTEEILFEANIEEYKKEASIIIEELSGQTKAELIASCYQNLDEEKIFSKEDLRILRNTIYARYGYKFRSKDLNELFSKTDWYSPKVNPENFDEDCYFSPLDESLLGVINLAEK